MKPDWKTVITGVEGHDPEPEVLALLSRAKGRVGTGGKIIPGKAKPTLANIVTVLQHDSRWNARVRYNEFDLKAYVGADAVTDTAETEGAVWMARVYSMDVASKAVGEGLRYVGFDHRFHPVRDYLDQLVWDGDRRAEMLLPTYLGAAATKLHKAIGQYAYPVASCRYHR